MTTADTPVQPDPPQPKVDPETLVLRARPMKAIRFRRGAIIGIAALGSASLMGIAWLALKPQVFLQVAQESELSRPSANSGDALSGLPAEYGDVPKLGPPLPGDLGRPILRAQQQPIEAAGTSGSGRSSADAAEAERLTKLAELKAARESGILVQTKTVDRAAEAPAISTAAVAPDAGTSPAPQDRKAAFAERPATGSDLNTSSLAPPASPYLLAVGSVIPASLITGLNSDLPGLVTAQITQNVFDSVSGQILLIPQGARLVGKYDSVVTYGQRRALVIWQRLMLPDGSSLRLDNFPATDAAGYAGLADKVDFHSWSLLKGVAIATLLGVGSELTINDESDLVEAMRESTQQNVARAGEQITSRNLDIQPTITVRPGTPVRLLVSRDLILAPWRGSTGE